MMRWMLPTRRHRIGHNGFVGPRGGGASLSEIANLTIDLAQGEISYGAIM